MNSEFKPTMRPDLADPQPQPDPSSSRTRVVSLEPNRPPAFVCFEFIATAALCNAL